MPALMLGMLVASQLHVTDADVESESHLLGTAVESEPRSVGSRLMALMPRH